jgi:hypothetical protein
MMVVELTVQDCVGKTSVLLYGRERQVMETKSTPLVTFRDIVFDWSVYKRLRVVVKKQTSSVFRNVAVSEQTSNPELERRASKSSLHAIAIGKWKSEMRCLIIGGDLESGRRMGSQQSIKAIRTRPTAYSSIMQFALPCAILSSRKSSLFLPAPHLHSVTLPRLAQKLALRPTFPPPSP